MAVIIKRYRVRHNGVAYGPGQPGGTVLEGLSEKEEAHLIEQSNGSIVKYVTLVPTQDAAGSVDDNGDVEPIAPEETEQESVIDPAPEENKQESNIEPDSEDFHLPDIKPEDLFRPGPDFKEK